MTGNGEATTQDLHRWFCEMYVPNWVRGRSVGTRHGGDALLLGCAAGERTGRYRIDTDQLLVDEQGDSEISAEDYAIAVADLVDTAEHLRETGQSRVVRTRSAEHASTNGIRSANQL